MAGAAAVAAVVVVLVAIGVVKEITKGQKDSDCDCS